MKSLSPEISVIIPVFNESQCINKVFEELENSLADISHEIIFIDDGSYDGTGRLLQKIQTKMTDDNLNDLDDQDHMNMDKKQNKNNIHVISFAARCGKACAQQAGISVAKGEYIVFMDGDGQDDPSDIPKLICRIKKENAAMVVGRRAHRISGRFYRFSSSIFNFFIRIVTNMKIRDINASMKIVKTEYLSRIFLYAGNYRFIPLLLHMSGFKVVEEDVNHRKRIAGESKYAPSKVFEGFWDFITILFLIRNDRSPLRFFGSMGLCLGAPGIGICIYISFLRFFYGSIQSRYPLLLLGILLILSGTQLFCTGLLAELMVYLRLEKTFFRESLQIRK